jgi:hypothetical protein
LGALALDLLKVPSSPYAEMKLKCRLGELGPARTDGVAVAPAATFHTPDGTVVLLLVNALALGGIGGAV